MSCKELRRAGILARVESGELKLVDAAVMMGMSYRQSKRLARRYREGGTEGLKHGSAGRESNRKKPKKFRERVLRLVRKKYSGEEGEAVRAGSGGALGGDSRPGCSSGSKIPGGQGQETKAVQAQSGSPLAEGLYGKPRPWSKPGASCKSLIKEISDGDSTGNPGNADDGEKITW